jgi:hypothetical protein
VAQTPAVRTYDVVTTTRTGRERVHHYASDEALAPGQVPRLSGRYWLVVDVERMHDGESPRALAVPARYRLRLRHPDGREEVGAFRRFRTGGPRIGHAFTTVEDGEPASWQVVDERLAYDERGAPYLDVVAERDFGEVEALPDHELEHSLARLDEKLPPQAYATLLRAHEEGSSFELVALEPGELPDWEEGRRFIDALVFEEIEDDLFELCGVDPDKDPRDTWLDTVKARLRSDLDGFKADIEVDHVQIEEWDYLDGRIFASVGTPEDESDPDSGHGWMCRLVDSEALGAAGFARMRKTEL